MDEQMISLECLYGHVEVRSVHWIDGDTLHMGGYSIRYDGDGKEVSRTKPTANSSMTGPWQEHLHMIRGERIYGKPLPVSPQEEE